MNEANQTTTASSNQNISIYDYRCDMESAIPKDIQVFRGESVKIVASLYDNNQKQSPTGTASFYWQTKEMEVENQWWIKTATITEDGDLEVVFDSSTQDNGSDSYTWFFGISTEEGVNTRAHGTIHMRYGIGLPNELPLPTQIIDFDVVEVLNPPWVPLIDGKVSTSGDTMTGPLNINQEGVNLLLDPLEVSFYDGTKIEPSKVTIVGDHNRKVEINSWGVEVFGGNQEVGNPITWPDNFGKFALVSQLPGFETWTFEVVVSGATQTVTKKVAIYPQQ